MSTTDLLPELAEHLDLLVPPETVAGDWSDVVRRARGGRFAFRGARLALVALAVFLLLAGVATATYWLLSRSAPTKPDPGALTLVLDSSQVGRPSGIVEVVRLGQLRYVWRCPVRTGCGHITSVDWSNDGRRLAFTSDSIAALSPYLGLNIIDLRSGNRRYLSYADPRLGCFWPSQVQWSPDGRELAYRCFTDRSTFDHPRVFVIRSDGTGGHQLNTGRHPAMWPTWSPDGKRLAFATGSKPSTSSVYVVDRDGAHVRLLARNATMPDWSATGPIALDVRGGIEILSSSGKPVTRHLGRRGGAPRWSHDGKMLAVAHLDGGVSVLGDIGSRTHKGSTRGGVSALGIVRPAWYPDSSRLPAAATPSTCPDC